MNLFSKRKEQFLTRILFKFSVLFLLALSFLPNLLIAQEREKLVAEAKKEAIFKIGGYQDGEILLNLFRDSNKEIIKSESINLPAFTKFEFKKSSNLNKKTYQVTATAYSSTVEETDSTPCITANGLDVCKNNREDIIATNFLKFGTRVKIPDLYGDQVFTVVDRMNPRYDYRIDLWKMSKDRAIQFGKRTVTIEVLD